MSQDRIYIYVDGVLRPAWKPNPPGYARAAGSSLNGDIVVGVSEGKANVLAQRVRDERKRQERLARPPAETCGAWMKKNKEPCAILAGHAGHHRGREASLMRSPRAAA